MKYIKFIFIASLFMSPWVLAESSQGFEALLGEAESHNPDIQRLKAVVDAAEARESEAFAGFLPRVGLMGRHVFDTKYSSMNVVFGGNSLDFPAGMPQTTLSLTGELPLFDGFQTWNLYHAALLKREAAGLDLQRAEFRLEEELRKRLSRMLLAQELASVASRNIETLESHLELSKASSRSGYATRFDELRIGAQLEEARAEKLLQDDDAALARREVFRQMGLDHDDGRVIQGQLDVPDEHKVPATLAFDLAARQDYQAKLRNEEAEGRQRQAANAFWWPRISLFGEGTLYKFGSFDPMILSTNFRNAYSVGLQLSWNLYDGGSSLAKRREAEAVLRASQQATQGAQLDVAQEFDQWKRRYLYNAALYRARRRTIEKSEESVRLALAGLKAGIRTHTEVLDSELDLFRARAGAVRAQAEAAEALANLELALGRHL